MNCLDFLNTLGYSSNINEEFFQLFSEGHEDTHIFKVIFLQGPNLSGKDFILDKLLDFQSLTEINSVKAFEYLLGKSKLDFSNPEALPKVKSETELKERLALLGRNGIIINGTADSFEKIQLMKQILESLGYESIMIMVNVDDETAKQRNVERGKTGGRIIPELIRKEKWDEVQNNRAQFGELFGEGYLEFDNSVDLRSADPQTAIQKNQELQQLLETVQEFLDAEPSSDLAKNWIETEQMAGNNMSVNESVSVSFTADTTEELNDLFDNLFGDKKNSKEYSDILSGIDARKLLSLGKKMKMPENSDSQHTFTNSDVIRESKLLKESTTGLGLSIKGSDYGLSMNSSGEGYRDTGEVWDKKTGKSRIKLGRNGKKGIVTFNTEAIGAEGQSIENSTAEPIVDSKKKKGITIST